MKFLLPTLVASVLLSACGSSSSTAGGTPAAPSSSSSSSAAIVKTASNSSVGGTVLVDSRGKTLYRLSGERAGRFICTSNGCLQVWHPLTVSGSTKPSGTVAFLGVVKRPNGVDQVTYKGQPLYTFAQDTAPGQANGQGVKDVGTWNAVTASATASTTQNAASTTTSAPASGGYGY